MSDSPSFTAAGGWRAWAIPLLFFFAVAPTLPWSEFSSGSENLNVGTALEIRRTGKWLFPTLQGQPRIAKPPLVAWFTAACISDRTMADLSSADPAERRHAFNRLAWEIRLPALIIACLGILAVHEIGKLLGGPPLGIASALVYGTTYAFLRFSRIATTDVHLTFWVLWANVFLLKGILERRPWLAAIGAGVAIALAFMSKGPVALVQTLAPAAIFALWLRRRTLRYDAPLASPAPDRKTWIIPAFIGMGIGAMLGLSWFVAAALQSSDGQVWEIWRREVLRDEATSLEPSEWYNYLSVIPLLLPWVVFLIGGVMNTVEEIQRDRSQARRAAPMLFLTVPILIMSLFDDRKDRYLSPMIGPAAVIIGQGLLGYFRAPPPLNAVAKIGAAAHWCIVAVAALGLPILGATSWIKDMRTASGGPWFPPAVWIPALLCCALLLILGLIVHHRRRPALLTITVTIILIAQGLYAYGYGRSAGAKSEMRPLADTVLELFPDAVFYGHRPSRRTPEDLAIYLNRTVHQVPSPAAIAHSDRRQLLFTYRRNEDPISPPPSWNYLTSAPRGDNFIDAFYRLPSERRGE